MTCLRCAGRRSHWSPIFIQPKPFQIDASTGNGSAGLGLSQKSTLRMPFIAPNRCWVFA